jgi:hypothetical protein
LCRGRHRLPQRQECHASHHRSSVVLRVSGNHLANFKKLGKPSVLFDVPFLSLSPFSSSFLHPFSGPLPIWLSSFPLPLVVSACPSLSFLPLSFVPPSSFYFRDVFRGYTVESFRQEQSQTNDQQLLQAAHTLPYTSCELQTILKSRNSQASISISLILRGNAATKSPPSTLLTSAAMLSNIAQIFFVTLRSASLIPDRCQPGHFLVIHRQKKRDVLRFSLIELNQISQQ